MNKSGMASLLLGMGISLGIMDTHTSVFKMEMPKPHVTPKHIQKEIMAKAQAKRERKNAKRLALLNR